MQINEEYFAQARGLNEARLANKGQEDVFWGGEIFNFFGRISSLNNKLHVHYHLDTWR